MEEAHHIISAVVNAFYNQYLTSKKTHLSRGRLPGQTDYLARTSYKFK